MTEPTIDRRLVHELAELARLELTPQQEDRAVARLGRIAGILAALREAPLEAVEPSPYAQDLRPVLRPDEPEACLAEDEVLANAPRTAAGCFLVPRTVEG